MSSAAPFDGIVGGRLKLKGEKRSRDGEKKKQKRRKKRRVQEDDAAPAPTDAAAAAAAAASSAEVVVVEEEPKDKRTPAQRHFDEMRAKREARVIKSMVSMTHREKVERFNEYLSSLSEHHDIPKIASAGNG